MAAISVACVALLIPSHTHLPMSRRGAVASLVTGTCAALLGSPSRASASKDCFTDCYSNCARNAPGSTSYCKDTCDEYCAQPDRRDGLSGSVSSDAGEVGFASAYDYANRLTNRLNSNVEFGTDRLPPVPGLEGTAAGRALAEAAGVRARKPQ